MSFGNIEIYFDNPQATYFNGQNVTGNVVVELLKEKRFRAIELRFLGEAKVHWTEGDSDDETNYNNREVYLDNSVYLLGGPNTDITLPPGKYNYPFRLILPSDIPSSFEGRYGKCYVRYTVKVSMCRPWRFDHKCKAAFTVLNPLDLNREPALMEPAQTTTEKRLCCGCCGAPITVVVSVPFAGYVPGQSCKGLFELDNPTNNSMSLKACVIQVVKYTSKCKNTKTEKKTISKQNLGFVTARGSMTSSFDVQIPPVPDSYLRNCNCIDISYNVEIRGNISGMHRDLHGSVPIVIGSIPLRTQFAHISQWNSQRPPVEMNIEHSRVKHTEQTSAHGSSSVACAMPGPFLHYPEMPPPSYQESVSGKTSIRSEEDNEYVRGVMDFAPRYPVYSFQVKNS